MNRFEYVRADSIADAVGALAAPGARALAGGTNLVDLMKYDVAKPARVVDINRLPLKEIEPSPDGGLTIGALVTNSGLAWDPRIAEGYPLLASAILRRWRACAITLPLQRRDHHEGAHRKLSRRASVCA